MATNTPLLSTWTTTPSSAVELHATWTTNGFDISFDKNDVGIDLNGAVKDIIPEGNDPTGTMTDTSVAYDSTLTLPANGFSLTGYEFLGWSTNKNATSATYTDGETLSATQVNALYNNNTTTLYAIWQICQRFPYKRSHANRSRNSHIITS